jgi:regulator of sirC expression with transglutaminase-like and TPR domain
MNSQLEHFAELVSSEQFDLALACMMIGQDVYPELDIPAGMARIEAMAETVRGRFAEDAFAEQRLAVLNHYLFNEQRFSGNSDDYYDPRNSYLHEVLERRTGIPITLSIVFLEVGRRIGLALNGVAFPGHFMVKLQLKRGQLVLDPFNSGLPQSESELRQRLGQVLKDGRAKSMPLDEFLEAASPRQIVTRLLRNLKNVYMNAGKHELALDVMHRMLLVAPEAVEELRDRGLLYAQLDCFRAASGDLQNYLRRRPNAPDATEIHGRVVELTQAAARLN